MKKFVSIITMCIGALGLTVNVGRADDERRSSSVGHFTLAATYQVSGEVAEIVATTPNGKTLLYTDSAAGEVGVVDINDPTAPVEITTIAVAGEPTSVAVTRFG